MKVQEKVEHIFNVVEAEHYPFRDGSNFFVQANINPEYKNIFNRLYK